MLRYLEKENVRFHFTIINRYNTEGNNENQYLSSKVLESQKIFDRDMKNFRWKSGKFYIESQNFFRYRDGKFYIEIWKVLDREMGGLDRNGEGINYQETLQPLRTR